MTSEEREEREELLKETEKIWSDPKMVSMNLDPVVKRHFGASSHGHTEIMDRVHIQSSVWWDHIADHPTILLDPKSFEMAREIGDKMNELYQRLGGMEDPEKEQE